MSEYRAYGETICSNCGRVLKAINSKDGIYADNNKIEETIIASDEDSIICRCKECNTKNRIILKQF